MPLLLKESLVSDSLKAISPLDGRYSKSTEPLSDYFSEHALIRYRTKIEIEYLISLSLEKGIKELNPFSDKADMLVNIHSTLQMPSQTPVFTVIDPGNCALAVKRIFGA